MIHPRGDGRPGGNQPPEPGPINHHEAAEVLSRTNAAVAHPTCTRVQVQCDEFRPVPGWTGFYVVARRPEIVASVDRIVQTSTGPRWFRGRQLRPNRRGAVLLSRPGRRVHRSVARLVREAFGQVAA